MPITLTGGGTVTGNVSFANSVSIVGNTTLTGPVTFSSNNVTIGGSSISPFTGFKNRIINGDMRIDQRNAGASITPTVSGTYSVDRWAFYGSVSSKLSYQQNGGSVTPPVGFSNYLGITSTSTYSVSASDAFRVYTGLEGYNISDFAWGTASAKTITLSFWVRSSLTGTFGGNVYNASSRNYTFSYTINTANTWEYKTVTIPGDTSGTWTSNNSLGLYLQFSLGAGSNNQTTPGSWGSTVYLAPTGQTSVVGTNGATFYLTGVQLEEGSVATPFEFRPVGLELALCQRYYYRLSMINSGSSPRYTLGLCRSTTNCQGTIPFPVTMRIAPTALEQSGTATHYGVVAPASSPLCSSVPIFSQACQDNADVLFTVASGLTAGNAGQLYGVGGSGYLGWSAEL